MPAEKSRTTIMRLPDGSVNPEWLNSLNHKEMLEWVRGIIRERDPVFPAWSIESQSHFLGETYCAASDNARNLLEQSLMELLQEMSTWHSLEEIEAHGLDPRSCNELILAAAYVSRGGIVPLVAEMVDGQAFVGVEWSHEIGGDLHSRLLQQLARFDHQQPLDYWRRQVRLNPEMYLAPSMRGAKHSGLDHHLLLEGIEMTGSIERITHDVDEIIAIASEDKSRRG